MITVEKTFSDRGSPNSSKHCEPGERRGRQQILAAVWWPVECGGQENVKVNLNNRIRRHGLSACQIHFPRDQNTGENLPIQDSKLQEVREARKEASPRHQAVTTPCPQPGQLRDEGTKHTGKSPRSPR